MSKKCYLLFPLLLIMLLPMTLIARGDIPSSMKPYYLILVDGSRDELEILSTALSHSSFCAPYKFFERNALIAANTDAVKNIKKFGVSYQILGKFMSFEKLLWISYTENSFPLDISKYGRVLYNSKDACLVACLGQMDIALGRDSGFGIRRLFPLEWSFKNRDFNFEAFSKQPFKDPIIEELVEKVDSTQIKAYVQSLENCKTRLSYAPEVDDAAQYIYDTFDALGLNVEFDEVTMGGGPVLMQGEFASKDVGWAAGYGPAILRTSNGGTEWIKCDIPSDEDPEEIIQYLPVLSMDFINENEGWVGMVIGYMLHTTDGGATWEIVSFYDISIYYYFDLSFIDSNNGWAIGYNQSEQAGVYKTSNGGATWTLKKTFADTFLGDIQFLDQNTGFVAGQIDSANQETSGVVYKTTDGGTTWELLTEQSHQDLFRVQFLDVNNGWAGGSVLLNTKDSGVSWTHKSVPMSDSMVTALKFTSSKEGAVVDHGKIFGTVDRGNSWYTLSTDTTREFYALDIITPKYMWAFGQGNRIMYSDDLGLTWNNQMDQEPRARNVFATLKGKVPEDSCFIICAHYDAISENPFVSAPGADDNGSGTAGVLEAARILKDQKPKYTQKFMLWAMEEQGLVGSYDYAGRASEQDLPILGVINMDMILNMNNSKEDFDLGYNLASGDLAKYFMDMASIYTDVPFQWHIDTSGGSDHASFWEYGYDAIEISEDTANEIWSGSNPYYHKTTDLVENYHFTFGTEGIKAALASLAGLGFYGLHTGVDDPGSPGTPHLPQKLELFQNSPNPFNPATTIAFDIPQSVSPNSHAPVMLKIYDIHGALVRTLLDAQLSSGHYELLWNGVNESGLNAGSGVYYYSLTVGSNKLVKKMLLIE